MNVYISILWLKATRFYQILVSAATSYNRWKEQILEKFLKRNNFLSKIALSYFRFVILFHYHCQQLGHKIDQSLLCMLFIGLSVVLSRYNFAMVGWVFILLYLRLEFSYFIIHRFYQKRPMLIPQHFPESQDPKRKMHRAGKVLLEAAQQHPLTTAVVSGASGFVAWKYMEYKTAVETRENNRETIAGEAIQRQKDRDAEYIRHRESIEAEAVQRQKDRDAEDRRHREFIETENTRNKEPSVQENVPTENLNSFTEIVD